MPRRVNAPVANPAPTPRAAGIVRCLRLAALALVLFGTKLCIIDAYGDATPLWDQWDAESKILYTPFLEGHLGWSTFVGPHVVHRIATTRVVLLASLMANGIWNPLAQMVLNAALWVGTVVMIVGLLDRATGRGRLPLLLAFALVAFGLPHAHENTLAGLQVSNALVVFWSVLSLRSLATVPPFTATWWSGIACSVLAFLSFGSGAFTAAAAAGIAAAQYATGARRGIRQAAAIALLGGLFVAAILLTPYGHSEQELGARSAGQAARAWLAVLGWPLRIGPFGAVVSQWPGLVLAVTMLRRPPAARDPRWLLLAVWFLALGQGAGIAFGRAAACLESRYTDLFAVGLIGNFASALVTFPDFAARWPRRMVAAVVGWTGVVLAALAVHVSRHSRTQMEARRDTARHQRANTRAYVLTGDIRHLEDKPFLHVPYPRADRLAAMLDDPTVRSYLPSVIAPPLPATSFASDPTDAFVPGGTGPGLPDRDEPVWGSHGLQAAEAVGTAVIGFASPHRGHAVELPVVVGGSADGITIEVEQDGERRAVPLPPATGSWVPVRVTVNGRPFTLHVVDGSREGWVAVAAPVAEGRFDRRVARMLDRWDRFVLAGMVLAVMLAVQGALSVPRDQPPPASA